jgi:hypothetical protein
MRQEVTQRHVRVGVFYKVARPRHTSVDELWIMPTGQV